MAEAFVKTIRFLSVAGLVAAGAFFGACGHTSMAPLDSAVDSHPDQANDHVIFMSDTHDAYRNPPIIIVNRLLEINDLFLLLHGGDMVDSGDVNPYAKIKRHWDDFRDLMTPLVLRSAQGMMAAIGNHDSMNKGTDLPIKDMLVTGETRAWREFDRFVVYVLNTEVRTDQETAAVRQMFIDTANIAKLKIVMLHIPPFAPQNDTVNNWVEVNYVPLFQPYGIRLVLAGDDHLYSRGVYDGVTYIISGGDGGTLESTCIQSFTMRACATFYNYIDLKIYDDRIFGTAMLMWHDEFKAFDTFEIGRP